MKSAPLPGTRASDDGSLCLEPPRRPAASRRPISPAVAARRREWNLSDLRWPLDTLNGTGFRDRFIIERRDTIASIDDIAGQIATLQHRPRAVDRERSDISSRLNLLEQARAAGDVVKPDRAAAIVTLFSSSDAKIALFRSLVRGRADVLPRLWENRKTGQAGYAPMRRNEWVRGVCKKPQVKCGA